jgi:hypothetical protein
MADPLGPFGLKSLDPLHFNWEPPTNPSDLSLRGLATEATSRFSAREANGLEPVSKPTAVIPAKAGIQSKSAQSCATRFPPTRE